MDILTQKIKEFFDSDTSKSDSSKIIKRDIYRLFEKHNDYTELSGTNLYFIKKYNDNNNDIEFLGKKIDHIYENTNSFSLQEFEKWNIEYTYTLKNNNIIHPFIFEDKLNKTSSNIRLLYTNKIPLSFELDFISYIDDTLNEKIIEELIKNEYLLESHDKKMLNELLGENSYVSNDKVKFLFKIKEINFDFEEY